MPTYLVRHDKTGAFREVDAPSPLDACNEAGWPIGRCHVERLAQPGDTVPARRYPARPERLLLQQGTEAMDEAAQALGETTQLLRCIRKLSEVAPLDLETARRLIKRIHRLASGQTGALKSEFGDGKERT